MGKKSIGAEEKKFRFEDYHISGEFEKNAKAARKALLALHPVGTSVDALLRTLVNAEAKCTLPSIGNIGSSNGNKIFCRYDTSSASIFGYTITLTNWIIEIVIDHNLIQDIRVTVGATGP